MPVGHGEGGEDAVHRDRVDGQLGPVDQLLHERTATARLGRCSLDRCGEPGAVVDEREPALALAVGSLDHAGKRDLRVRGRERAWLGHPGRSEPLSLSRLRRGEHGRRAVDRMGQAEVLGHPGCNPYRPVGTRRDEAVNGSGSRKALHALLVLGRDHGTLRREREPSSQRIAVDGDHRQIAGRGSLEEAELRGACA